MKNPFRPEYRELKRNEVENVDALKAAAFELLKQIPIGTRESSIAITKLEEVVMWGTKSITSG